MTTATTVKLLAHPSDIANIIHLTAQGIEKQLNLLTTLGLGIVGVDIRHTADGSVTVGVRCEVKKSVLTEDISDGFYSVDENGKLDLVPDDPKVMVEQTKTELRPMTLEEVRNLLGKD